MTCEILTQIQSAWNAVMVERAAAGAAHKAAMVGAVVRLAFHDAGEFDGRFPAADASFGSSNRPLVEPYGPDGCLTQAGDHNGLTGTDDEVNAILEPIWQDFCDATSRADFWVAMATFALHGADSTDTLRARLPFEFGRKDVCNCDAGEHLRDVTTGVLTGSGRMPIATRGLDTIRDVFVTQMGLTLAQATALLGAHTIGGMSPENSGFGLPLNVQAVQTPWVQDNTAFTNDYFVEMIGERWDPLRPRDSGRSPFVGSPPQQWHDQTSAVLPKVVFLNADMALAYHTGIEDTAPGTTSVLNPVSGLDWCGGLTDPLSGAHLCVRDNTNNANPTEHVCCADADSIPGSRRKVDQYRDPTRGLNAFLEDFAVAFRAMTSVGYGGGRSRHRSKLGSLSELECGLTDPPAAPPPPTVRPGPCDDAVMLVASRYGGVTFSPTQGPGIWARPCAAGRAAGLPFQALRHEPDGTSGSTCLQQMECVGSQNGRLYGNVFDGCQYMRTCRGRSCQRFVPCNAPTPPPTRPPPPPTRPPTRPPNRYGPPPPPTYRRHPFRNDEPRV